MHLVSFDIWRLQIGMLYLVEQIVCCPILASTVHIGMEFPGVVQVGSPALKVCKTRTYLILLPYNGETPCSVSCN